jgi:glycosyltransferase involved in cell wall biosynthesis
MNVPRSDAAPRVLHLVTSDLSTRLMRGQLRYLSARGFDVFLASSPGRDLEAASSLEQVRAIAVPMVRENSPLQDLFALYRLYGLMRRLRPAITNVSTPKAGLLGGLAAWLSRVPCRVYTLRGLRWETASGAKRLVLKIADWVACHCAHRVVCVSQSVRHTAVACGVVDPDRTCVLGAGSSNGVDPARFGPSEEKLRKAIEIRERLGISPEAPVVGFVGRLTRDKGIPELYEAHKILRKEFPSLKLMILGEYETGDPLPQQLQRAIGTDPSVIRPGFVDETSDFYHVFDILALPSYREGFPNVVLEAQAAGRVVVAARATGTVDAIADGVTGLLVPIADVAALADALGKLLRNPSLAARMGVAGRARVVHEFKPEKIWRALAEEYIQLLHISGLPLPNSEIPSSDSFAVSGSLLSSS